MIRSQRHGSQNRSNASIVFTGDPQREHHHLPRPQESNDTTETGTIDIDIARVHENLMNPVHLVREALIHQNSSECSSDPA